MFTQFYSHKPFLQKEGITHIINCCNPEEGFVFPFKDDYKYEEFACEDDEDFEIGQHFANFFEALRKIKDAKGKVLVFDMNCRGVPATLVLSYMLHSSKKQDKYLPLKKALEYVAQKDMILKPNDSFLLHLASLEEELFEECSARAVVAASAVVVVAVEDVDKLRTSVVSSSLHVHVFV
jgi:hypothetical protein